MPMPTVEKLFPGDVLYPEKFSVEEREYLIKHAGSKPSVLEENPPDNPSSAMTLQVALLRLFDDKYVSAHRSELVDCLERSLEGVKVREVQKQLHGDIGFSRIGVGLGRGQHSFDKSFAFPLSPSASSPDSNFYAEAGLLDEKEAAKAITEPRDVADSFFIECKWGCPGDRPYRTEGRHAVQGMFLHVRGKHRDNVKQFSKDRPELVKAFRRWTGRPAEAK